MGDGSIAVREASLNGSDVLGAANRQRIRVRPLVFVDLAVIAGTMASVIVGAVATLLNHAAFAKHGQLANPPLVLAHIAIIVLSLLVIVASAAVILRSTVAIAVDAVGIEDDQRFAALATRILRVTGIVASATVIVLGIAVVGMAADDTIQPREEAVISGTALIAVGVIGLTATVPRTGALLKAELVLIGWPWIAAPPWSWATPRHVVADAIASLTDLSSVHRHDIAYVVPRGPHGLGVIPDQYLPRLMNAGSTATTDDQVAYFVELAFGHRGA